MTDNAGRAEPAAVRVAIVNDYEVIVAGLHQMLAAFEGWNDAGEAATSAVAHLHRVWDAREVVTLDPEEYHDFQVNRPLVTTGEDGPRRIVWPATTLSVVQAPVTGRQLVLVQGIEPSMRWRRYTEEVLGHAERLGETHSLGALACTGRTDEQKPRQRSSPS